MAENTGLNNLKAKDKVWQLMERHNPQLGVYYVFEEKEVTRVSAKSISVGFYLYDKVTGEKKEKEQSVYGSSKFTIMTKEDAVKLNEKLLGENKRVRGLV